ncbi:hypothetical protein CXF95_25765 [Paraglaciecola sp. MB-3u-78]|nr:hypothetical protein CXF95_25765 [Paraglaciecola sp. MB-3u-78]
MGWGQTVWAGVMQWAGIKSCILWAGVKSCILQQGDLFENNVSQNNHQWWAGVKSCILQQGDLFENNVSQNNHLFVFAYSHQSGRHYRWLDAYQQFELGIQQVGGLGSSLVFCNKATYLRIM